MRSSSVLALVLSSLAAFAAANELQILKTKEVECESKTKAGDTISVHYRGTLESTGEQFDASYDRGQPFQFVLGAGNVIKGWDQGLLDMCVGEGRKLIIPFNMAYGEGGMPPVIPPKSTLVFETELISITPGNREL